MRLHMSLAAGLLAVVFLLAAASPVAANAPKPPKFSGAAPGLVNCSVTAKVSFSPPLNSSGGGTNPSVVKGTLSGCTIAGGAGVTITKGTITGSFPSSPLNCVTLGNTGVEPTFTLKWKGSFNGTVGGITYAGKASFTPTMVIPGFIGLAVTGSFGGGGVSAGLELSFLQGNNAAVCGSKKGIKKLPLDGLIETQSSFI